MAQVASAFELPPGIAKSHSLHSRHNMAELRFLRELLGLTEPVLLELFRSCNSDTAVFQRKVLLRHPKRDLFMPCDPETDVRVPSQVVGSMLSQLEALEKISTGNTFWKSFLEKEAPASSVQTPACRLQLQRPACRRKETLFSTILGQLSMRSFLVRSMTDGLS